jgi:putative ABC transport system substrate-binding protein
MAMRRRAFIAALGSAAAWPLAARAQQLERMRLIGMLMPFAEGDPETQQRVAALRQGLAQRGWNEGRNLRIEYRWATTPDEEARRRFAKELVDL